MLTLIYVMLAFYSLLASVDLLAPHIDSDESPEKATLFLAGILLGGLTLIGAAVRLLLLAKKRVFG